MDSDRSLCADCGTDTTPCTSSRGCRHKGRWEHYMVHDKLWPEAGMANGYLCIGCLEERLGRELRASDFTDTPINQPDPWEAERLANRTPRLR